MKAKTIHSIIVNIIGITGLILMYANFLIGSIIFLTSLTMIWFQQPIIEKLRERGIKKRDKKAYKKLAEFFAKHKKEIIKIEKIKTQIRKRDEKRFKGNDEAYSKYIEKETAFLKTKQR